MLPDACDRSARDVASLPLSFGGMGLRSAVRTAVPAYWSSWVDALSMISQRHRTVATTLVHELSGHISSSTVGRSTQRFGRFRSSVLGCISAAGMRPNLRNAEDVEPASFRTGWQHEAAARMEWQHRERVLKPVLSDSARALLRAQSGPAAGMSLSAVPSSPQTRVESQLFRVLLLRRFRLLLPPFAFMCRCGRLLDSFGHRASCAQGGGFGKTGIRRGECCGAHLSRGRRESRHKRVRARPRPPVP